MFRWNFNAALAFFVWLGGSTLAGAQLATEPLMVPPRAEERVLDWSQTFPVTPPFSQWTNIASLTDAEDGQDRGALFLHDRSVARVSAENLPLVTTGEGPFVSVDYIHFSNGSDGSAPFYRRALVVLACDSTKAAHFKAYADVVIGPDGVIRPQSNVLETIGYTISDSVSKGKAVFDLLCFNDEIHRRFAAPQ